MSSTIKLFRYCIAVIGISILAGCAGTRTVDEKSAALHLANSDYRAYATQFLNDKGEPKYDPESLLDSLEAGKAFNDAGMWQLSRDAFDAASKLLHWKEDTVDTPSEVANLLGTTLTSDAFGAYQGGREFDAELFQLDARALTPGIRVLIKHGTATVQAIVAEVLTRRDLETLAHGDIGPQQNAGMQALAA